MANVEHEALAYGEQHVIHFAEYANSTAREAASGLTSGDDHKVALQTNDHSYWILTNYSGPTWLHVGLAQADSIDGTKIADDAIDSEHYTDGSIDLAHMAANSVDSGQYVDGSIDAVHLSSAVKESVVKGWVNFNGTGAIADSFNVSSITDNGVGDYRINWDTDFANDDYATCFSTSAFTCNSAGAVPLVGSIGVETYNTLHAVTDPAYVYAIALGDQ